MANWAIVIGIDRYWSEGAHLRGAVRDALSVHEWLLDPAGGNVPATNLQLVLSPGPNSPAVGPELGAIDGTKSNIVIAINNLMVLSGGKGERLYFFFAGHGLTSRISNRDESAVLATNFTNINTDQSLALRSVWEFFETTQFDDQFLFVDACRNVPPWGEGAEFELGRWTLPRSRDPGMPPVQQFILYATSPKLKAAEVRDKPGEEHGAFTAALLDGLRGAGPAKAWSWDRQCYEVRWERLANYVKNRVERERRKVADTPEGEQIQIPQDTGSRGVAGRDRDALLTSFPAETFAKERLEIFLDPDSAYPAADVRVLNPLGDVVAGQVGVTGTSAVFYVSPGTYALRAAAPDIGEGRVTSPIELYETLEEPPRIQLRPLEAPAPAKTTAEPAEEAPAATRSVGGGVEAWGTGRIPIEAPDPLSIVEVKDETGNVVKVALPLALELPAGFVELKDETGKVVEVKDETGKPVEGAGMRELELPAGFYQLRHVGPESASDKTPLALAAGEREKPLELKGTELSPATLELLHEMGGAQGSGNTMRLEGCEPIAWGQTSTLVALALGRALGGETGSAALRITPPRSPKSDKRLGGIAVYIVSEVGSISLASLEVRVWKAGTPVARTEAKLRKLRPGLIEFTKALEPGLYWLSIRREGEGRTMVFALTVLNRRMATILVQITAGIHLFQYQPALGGGAAATPNTLRHVEYLERSLLSGRLDGAGALALELAATDDPFVGCLCGYVLLRLGHLKELGELVERVITTAPQLSDGFVLRGEHAAATGGTTGKQAFTEAIAAGVPVFGEGLTRLLEGLHTYGVEHPRAAIVRYVFQNHMRGSMWSVFTPRRFEPNKLVVTAADTGHEA